MPKYKQIDKQTKLKIQLEAIKVVARMNAFPRKLSMLELEKITAKATEAELIHAHKKVHRMNMRLRLIRISGITVILLGLLSMFLSTNILLIASIISIGLGILGATLLFGWATGLCKINKIGRHEV